MLKKTNQLLGRTFNLEVKIKDELFSQGLKFGKLASNMEKDSREICNLHKSILENLNVFTLKQTQNLYDPVDI